MRHAIGVALSSLVLLSACTVPTSLTETRKATTAKATPTPAASATPAASGVSKPAGATPTPTPTPVALPSATPTPSVPMKALAGLFKVDASYIIAAGGGNIIAAGGGNIIAAGGGNIIAAGGGNMLAGGNIIAAGGGNVIAAGGGNIIAAGGGNILAGGTSLFRLLEASSVKAGTILPVKGMVVVPISLLTGKPIGPAVTTDEKGAYQVQVPEATSENVLIYGAMPVKDTTQTALLNDPRLRFGVLANPKEGTVREVDEEMALATRYTLACLVARLKAIIDSPDPATKVDELVLGGATELPLVLRAAMRDKFQEIVAVAKESGYDALPDEAAKQRMVYAATDALSAYIDWNGIRFTADVISDPTTAERLVKAKDPVIGVFMQMFKLWGDAAAVMLNAPSGFVEPFYIKDANATRAEKDQYRILKPVDMAEFIVREYMASNNPNGGSTDGAVQMVCNDLGVPEFNVVPGDDTTRVRMGSAVRAGNLVILRAIGQTMFNEQALTASKNAMRNFKP